MDVAILIFEKKGGNIISSLEQFNKDMEAMVVLLMTPISIHTTKYKVASTPLHLH